MTKNHEPKSNPSAPREHSEAFREAAREAAHRSDDGRAFLRDPEGGPAHTKDSLGEGLAEGFLSSATSGEEATELNDDVAEDEGGPFIETTGKQEFARGTDASNPKDAERAPFPTPNRR